jgi:uncharacterized membrane protein (DUF485 family)
MSPLHAAAESIAETSETVATNRLTGLRLFAVYFATYVVFMLVHAFAPAWMDVEVFAGVTLAVVSGLGLIGGAFAIALAYQSLCRTDG